MRGKGCPSQIWPPEADKVLRTHYHFKRPKDIAILLAAIMKRSITANMVIGRAHRLGLAWSRDAPRRYVYDSSEFLQSALPRS